MTVAETWCVSSPNAKLAIAVPTSVSLGADFIPYNAHRIYGPILYPFLVSLVTRNNFLFYFFFGLSINKIRFLISPYLELIPKKNLLNSNSFI